MFCQGTDSGKKKKANDLKLVFVSCKSVEHIQTSESSVRENNIECWLRHNIISYLCGTFLLTCSHYLLLGGCNKPKPPAGSDAPASLYEELHSVGSLWGQWAPTHEPWPPCWPFHFLPHYTNQNCPTLVRYADYTRMQLHSLIYLCTTWMM